MVGGDAIPFQVVGGDPSRGQPIRGVTLPAVHEAGYVPLRPCSLETRTRRVFCLLSCLTTENFLSVMSSGFWSFSFSVVSPPPAAFGWENSLQGYLNHKRTRPPRILQ